MSEYYNRSAMTKAALRLNSPLYCRCFSWLSLGIIEWGLYMYNRQVITNAVREGARHGVLMRPIPRDVQAENDAICNRVVDKGSSYLVTFGADELTCDEKCYGWRLWRHKNSQRSQCISIWNRSDR